MPTPKQQIEYNVTLHSLQQTKSRFKVAGKAEEVKRVEKEIAQHKITFAALEEYNRQLRQLYNRQNYLKRTNQDSTQVEQAWRQFKQNKQSFLHSFVEQKMADATPRGDPAPANANVTTPLRFGWTPGPPTPVQTPAEFASMNPQGQTFIHSTPLSHDPLIQRQWNLANAISVGTIGTQALLLHAKNTQMAIEMMDTPPPGWTPLPSTGAPAAATLSVSAPLPVATSFTSPPVNVTTASAPATITTPSVSAPPPVANGFKLPPLHVTTPSVSAPPPVATRFTSPPVNVTMPSASAPVDVTTPTVSAPAPVATRFTSPPVDDTMTELEPQEEVSGPTTNVASPSAAGGVSGATISPRLSTVTSQVTSPRVYTVSTIFPQDGWKMPDSQVKYNSLVLRYLDSVDWASGDGFIPSVGLRFVAFLLSQEAFFDSFCDTHPGRVTEMLEVFAFHFWSEKPNSVKTLKDCIWAFGAQFGVGAKVEIRIPREFDEEEDDGSPVQLIEVRVVKEIEDDGTVTVCEEGRHTSPQKYKLWQLELPDLTL